MKTIKMTTWIMLGLTLGIAAGYAAHALAPDAAAAKDIAGYFSIITDVFLRLIKMIIAPLVFGTLVSGIAGMQDRSAIGRIGMRAMAWFVLASLISLGLGLLLVNLLQVGRELNLPMPEASAVVGLNTAGFNLKIFITHVFPTSFADAMAKNEILQILVFSLFFGFALAAVKSEHSKTIRAMVDELVGVMLKLTDYVMRAAPLGVFAAMAAVVTTQGFAVLTIYAKLMGGFFFGLALLWALLIGVGYLFLRGAVFDLLRALKEPIMLAFSTASSEAAYPKMMEQLEKFGVNPRITGFVLPLGYSFNLDGSMMYMTFAALFIAQAYHIDLSLGTQLSMLLVLMVSSKGMAGVPRGSLVVVAAVLPLFHLPEVGILLIIGIDQFLDMGRTATNVVGNGIATSVIAKWEGELKRPRTPAEVRLAA
ncbi:MAG TPA: dicarboxylate/amino acid:cation symporter [Janthinobacterium sp.]|nr:dicarboxylate/amino acid:cation symporter [Janthinobacterium sp.]